MGRVGFGRVVLLISLFEVGVGHLLLWGVSVVCMGMNTCTVCVCMLVFYCLFRSRV